jgi:hypothetical protein
MNLRPFFTLFIWYFSLTGNQVASIVQLVTGQINQTAVGLEVLLVLRS